MSSKKNSDQSILAMGWQQVAEHPNLLVLAQQRDLDTWCEAVFTLPIAWPDVTDVDPHYLKKTSAHQLLSIRMQWECLTCGEKFRPNGTC